jgi:hypothetical protein
MNRRPLDDIEKSSKIARETLLEQPHGPWPPGNTGPSFGGRRGRIMHTYAMAMQCWLHESGLEIQRQFEKTAMDFRQSEQFLYPPWSFHTLLARTPLIKCYYTCSVQDLRDLAIWNGMAMWHGTESVCHCGAEPLHRRNHNLTINYFILNRHGESFHII